MAEPDSARTGSDRYLKLKNWVLRDMEARRDWLDEAKEMFDFYAGHQWSPADAAKMEEEMRPVITFEVVGPMIRSVSGIQSENRQEIRYAARGLEDSPVADVWTEAARWFDDQSDGPDADEIAFLDCLICGMGFVEARLDFDLDPEGEPIQERLDPYEMGWDYNARSRNLADARRIWRARDMTLGEARDLFPDADPSTLDARWAREFTKQETEAQVERYRTEMDGTSGETDLSDDDVVTLVRIEWWERGKKFRLPDNRLVDREEAERLAKEAISMQRMQEMEMQAQEAAAKGMMLPPPPAPDDFTAMIDEEAKAQVDPLEEDVRIYRYAWLGSEIIEEEEAPFQATFSYRAITGFRDQNKGRWYGLVRAMRDPQRMANKWLSQAVHILNQTAKGGVNLEEDAVSDMRQFEQTWARPDKPTIFRPGALAGGKVQPKPAGTFPTGFVEMMQFAIHSVRTATGINQEMQGLRQANQPGILEDMRRQQSMTTLSTFFKSMTFYRRQKGKLLLEMMQRWIGQERLAKIVGDAFAPEQVQAAFQADMQYDVIVDEMPTGPNQKALVWNMISGIWNSLPPLVQAKVWKYSPLPTNLVGEIEQAYMQTLQQQAPTPEQQERQAAMEAAQIAETETKALANAAKATQPVSQGVMM